MEGTYLATNQRIPRQWWRRASNEMRALTIANGALLALLLATSFYRKFVRIDCRAELPSIISNMIHDIHVSCGEAACNGVSDPMVTLDYLAGRSRVIETCRREIIAFFAAKPTYHNVDITVRPGPSLELRSLTPDPPLFCQMTRTLAETWHLYQFHLLLLLGLLLFGVAMVFKVATERQNEEKAAAIAQHAIRDIRGRGRPVRMVIVRENCREKFGRSECSEDVWRLAEARIRKDPRVRTSTDRDLGVDHETWQWLH
eukprot:m.136687 g.136687  ORF g.136687 m.136687 type:complete len:257 (+) comp9905_c0_seq1:1-771(+)